MDAQELEWKGNGRILLRIMLSRWCNYACPYCPQDHSRHQTYKGASGHWADRASPQEWLDAIERQLSQHSLNVHLTGGEPMLDKRNMEPLLRGLVEFPFVRHVHIDTNLSWRPARWMVAPGKIGLQVSFHPSETSEAEFFAKMRELRDCGWTIDSANMVVDREMDIQGFIDRFAAAGVTLNVSPLWNGTTTVDLSRWVHQTDLRFRSGEVTGGRMCLYPAVTYDVHPSGKLQVGCHPEQSGDLFGAMPKLPETYVPCPDSRGCYCEERYTFLKDNGLNLGLSPLHNFIERQKERRACASA